MAKIRNTAFDCLVFCLCNLLLSLPCFAVDFHDEVISWEGKSRIAHIHIPKRTQSILPAVIAFHGGHGTGDRFDDIAHFSLVADREEFVLVYPEGIDKSWNDGRSEKAGKDDVGFISQLVNQLVQKYQIDPKRVFATGISNGGMFSFRLACDLSNKIAAIAPVAANMGDDLSKSCNPSHEIPILNLVGTRDPLMHFDGGQITGPLGFRKLGAILSSDATASYWAKKNHCNSLPTTVEMPDAAKDGTKVQREIYSGCMGGSVVSRIVIVGGGHTWPGGKQYLGEWLIGKTSKNVNATEEIWKFFKSVKK